MARAVEKGPFDLSHQDPGNRRPAVVAAAPPRRGAEPYFPFPLAHGGAVRIFHLLREMAEEFDIFLFAFCDRRNRPDLEPVLDLTARA
jgi:hypothetical protein